MPDSEKRVDEGAGEGQEVMLTFIIRYRVRADLVDMPEVLDALREYGEAEILSVDGQAR